MALSLARRFAALILTVTLIIPSQVFAVSKMVVDILPASTVMYMEIDLNQLPASVSDLITAKISSAVGETGDEKEERMKKLFLDIFKAKRGYIALKDFSITSEDAYGFAVPITEAQWKEMLAIKDEAEKKVSGTHEYYVDTEISFASLDGYLMLGQPGFLTALFASYDKGEFLSGSLQYSNTVKKLSPGNFFTLFFDYKSAMNDLETMMNGALEKKDSLSTITDVIREVALGMKKTDDGASIQTVVTKGPESEKYYAPFLPSLYKLAPAKKPLLYFEGFNVKKIYDYQIGQYDSLTGGESKELTDELKDELGFDVVTDFINLLTKGYSFTIENNASSLVPNMTLMADVKGDEAAMKASLKKLHKAMKKQAKGKKEMVTVIDPTTPDGADFSLVINLPEYDKDLDLGEASNTLTLGFEVNKDGILLVSTDAGLVSKYGMGFDAKDFGAQISSAQTLSLFSADLQEVVKLFTRTTEMQYSQLSEEYQKFFKAESALKHIATIAAPWHSIIAYSSSDTASVSSTVGFNFDSSVYTGAYWTQAAAAWKAINKASKQLSRLQDSFSDVDGQSWFNPQVTMLRAHGIVKGYYPEQDVIPSAAAQKMTHQEFRPGNHVTRAEFLTMLYRGVEGDAAPSYFGLDDISSDEGVDGFSDVGFSDWHFDVVQKAAGKGLVSGFKDGTFRPNAPISRAEAVAMIGRFYEHYNELEIFVDLPFRESKAFPDVAKDAWYYKQTDLAYQLGVVNGSSSGKFEPSRSLNRAESATLIYNLLRLKFERGE